MQERYLNLLIKTEPASADVWLDQDANVFLEEVQFEVKEEVNATHIDVQMKYNDSSSSSTSSREASEHEYEDEDHEDDQNEKCSNFKSTKEKLSKDQSSKCRQFNFYT